MVRPKIKTPEDRHAYLREWRRQKRARTVDIGHAHIEWHSLKHVLGIDSDAELAKLLIEWYYRNHEHLRGLSQNVTVKLDSTSAENSLVMTCENFDTDGQVPDNLNSAKVGKECVEILRSVAHDNNTNDCQDPSGADEPLVMEATNIKVESNSDVDKLESIPNYLEGKPMKIEVSKSQGSNILGLQRDMQLYTSNATSNKKKQNVCGPSARKKKSKPDFGKEIKHIVPLADEDKDLGNRRGSSRLQSKGFRLNYAAYDELIVETSDLDESDYDSEDELLGYDETLQSNNEEEKELDESGVVTIGDNYGLCRKRKPDNKDPDFDPEDFADDEEGVMDEEDSEGEVDGISEEFEVKKETKAELKRKEKIKERLLNKRNRIKVTLDNHKDKFYTEELVSTQMKDRGKSQKEKTSLLMVCALCKQYKTEDKTGLEMHLESHLNGDFDCQQCGEKFGGIHEMRFHKNQVHKKNGNFDCPDCSETLHTKMSFCQHMKRQHNRSMLCCKFCPATYLSRDAVREHYRLEHKDKLKMCEYCNEYIYTGTKKTHKAICVNNPHHEEVVPCEICGKEMKLQSLKQHKQFVHENLRAFNCPSCSYSGRTSQKLRLHTLAKHTGEHQYMCDQCEFTCVQSFQLTSHMRTHTGEKPFKCDQCSYAAAWNVQLKDHKKLHGLPFTATCETCGVVVKNNKCLNLHKKKEHKDDTCAK